MNSSKEDDSSGPSSLSSDQASLCVIPDPDDSFEEDGFIYLDKSSLPASLNVSDHGRTAIVFHSVDETYPADKSVLCQYIRPDGWKESYQDGISLFKVGWVAAAECLAHVAVPEPTSPTDPIGCVTFHADTLPKDVWNLYQFCYMRDGLLLGASTPFQFVDPSVDSNGKDTNEVSENAQFHNKIPNKDFETSVEDQAGLKKNQLTSASDMECFLQSCREMSHQPQQSNTDCHAMGSSSDVSSLREFCEDLESFGSRIQKQKEDGTLEASKDSFSEKCIMSSKSSFEFMQESIKTASHEEDVCSNRKSDPCLLKLPMVFTRQLSLDQSTHLKKRLDEVTEEKEWFQQQYNSLLIAMKKYSDDLASERSEKESLNGHIAELMISHKMMCSENTRLSNELETLRKNQQADSHENELLTESEVSGNVIEKQVPLKCKCEKYEKQLNDVNARLSAYEVMRSCLEAELEEEIKLGQERDRYLVQLEQIKLHDFQMANNWIASTPNAATSGNALLEMEQNVNSTLEALECTLKEMEVLRSRKAALNRANRILREEFLRKREEWETEMQNQRDDFVSQINDLKKELECAVSAKYKLEEEKDALKRENNLQLNKLEVSERQIQILHGHINQTQKECNYLRLKHGKLDCHYVNQQQNQNEDINGVLLTNLQEARDEYKKLYTEKTRIQEKLMKLQQKVRTKKSTRAQQEVTPSNTSEIDHSFDFMDNVSTTWRAIVDELM